MTNEVNCFKMIPLSALRQKGRLLLSQLLNPIKILPSEEGYPRDWRGIAHLSGVESNLNGIVITNYQDAMAKILQIWCTNNKSTATFDNLCTYLGIIDRWDVADDINEILIEDGKYYLEGRQQQQVQNKVAVSIEKPIIDENIITKDDVIRAQEGLSPQFYDAFVLFADEDVDFATELIEKMENYGFKLCVRERDLIGGISFEHEAILRLISERCNRLIVIVSPAFLESRANAFFVNFAQALGIEQGRRKIVPCLYERCVLPPTLNFYFLLNYQRSGKLWNFWEKLKDSIQSTPTELGLQNPSLRGHTNASLVPSVQITEVTSNQNISTKRLTESQTPIKPPRKRNDKENCAKFEKQNSLLSSSSTSSALCEQPIIMNSQLLLTAESPHPSSLELNLRAQSLMDLDKFQRQQQQQQIHSKLNCDITRSSTDISQLKNNTTRNQTKTTTTNNDKGTTTKWYKKFLSVSSIFENSSVKKTKKHLLKKKLATTVNS